MCLRDDPIRAMLHSGMKESLSDEIQLSGAGADVVKALLVYIHTDSLQAEPETVMELLVLANQYTLGPLVVLCESFLITVVDATDNAASLYAFADLFNLANLKSAVLTCVLRSAEAYQEFRQSEGFAELDPSLKQEIEEFRVGPIHMHMLFQPDHSQRSLLLPLDDKGKDRDERSSASPLAAAAARAGDAVTSSVGQVFRRVSWRRSSSRGADEDGNGGEPHETSGEVGAEGAGEDE